MNEAAEKRKFELLSKHLKGADADRAELLITRYLDTNPAPVYLEEIKSNFPEAYAGATVLHRAQTRQLTEDEGLIELLAFAQEPDEEFCQELDERLRAVSEQVQDVERTICRALRGDDERAQLIAAALALKVDLSELLSRAELASLLISFVVVGSPHAPQAAVFSAQVEPELTQNVFAKFIVDVLLDKDPEPVISEAAERRAIVAARTVLSLLDNPIPEVSYNDDDARHIAETARRAWAWATHTL